jgi:hypothetical protein
MRLLFYVQKQNKKGITTIMTTRKTKDEKITEALERRQELDNVIKRLQQQKREEERKRFI